MTRAELAQQALELSERDRFDLAHALWASLDNTNAFKDPPLPKWQERLLDERLEASAQEEGEDWEVVKAELWPESR